MKNMKKTFLLFATILMLFNSKTNAQTLTQNNWTSYCGWHYANTPSWGGWVRDFFQHSTGFDLIDTVGATLVVDTVMLNNLFNSLSTINPSVDILQLDGGLLQAKDTIKAKIFVDMIDADSGAFWKSLVYEQCNKLAQLTNSQNRLYYQLGNEITSAAVSKSLRYVQNLPYSSGFDYDQFNIPFFVEKYMAPTLEAIDSSSLLNFGSKGKINICLGSITNAGNSAALPFTNALLNYTIKGINAPSLAGKKVYELINIITIHYMMGNSSMNVWQNNLNGYANWIGIGRIKGVWSTEEVGIAKANLGAGAAYSARATFRYLKRAIDSSYASTVVRTNYWAWENGPANTQVDDFNSELYNFLGDVKLSYVDSTHTNFTSTTDLEWHGFLDSTSNKGVLAVLSSSSSISQIILVNNGWGNISNVSLTHYDTTGNYNIPVTLNFLTDSLLITFPVQNLSITDVLLFKINTSPSITSVEDFDLNKSISVYPNPTSGTVHINTSNSKIKSIKLFNLQGQLIQEYFTNDFSVANLPSGIYSINTQTDKSTFISKLIKQ
jgi:hypothetical protein